MPSGLNDAFYAASQALYSSDDITGQMAKMDSAWDSATSNPRHRRRAGTEARRRTVPFQQSARETP